MNHATPDLVRRGQPDPPLPTPDGQRAALVAAIRELAAPVRDPGTRGHAAAPAALAAAWFASPGYEAQCDDTRDWAANVAADALLRQGFFGEAAFALPPDRDGPLENLRLPTRAMKVIRKMGITTVSELVRVNPLDLMGKTNFGQVSLYAVRDALAARGLWLGMKSGDSPKTPNPNPV